MPKKFRTLEKPQVLRDIRAAAHTRASRGGGLAELVAVVETPRVDVAEAGPGHRVRAAGGELDHL